MTALSIPERAREIAAKIEPHIFDIEDCQEKCICPSFRVGKRKRIAAEIEKAMRSERELCAKELEAFAAESKAAGNYVQSLILSAAAAKLLRDGGK